MIGPFQANPAANAAVKEGIVLALTAALVHYFMGDRSPNPSTAASSVTIYPLPTIYPMPKDFLQKLEFINDIHQGLRDLFDPTVTDEDKTATGKFLSQISDYILKDAFAYNIPFLCKPFITVKEALDGLQKIKGENVELYKLVKRFHTRIEDSQRSYLSWKWGDLAPTPSELATKPAYSITATPGHAPSYTFWKLLSPSPSPSPSPS